MKKILVITTIIMTAAMSFGDLAIAWNNNGSGTVPVLDSTGLAVLPAGNYATLIWSATAPSKATTLLVDGTAVSGEQLLASTQTQSTGGFINGGATKYTDADVGGADINNGYFFTRIFDTVTPTTGGYYAQNTAIGSTLVEAPAGILPPNLTHGVDGYSDPAFSTFGPVDTQYTVVPEPATIGLFGLGALSAWIIRRNKAKATEKA
jgi:hypothetical protein